MHTSLSPAAVRAAALLAAVLCAAVSRRAAACAALVFVALLFACASPCRAGSPSPTAASLPPSDTRAIEEFRRKIPLDAPTLAGDPYALDAARLPDLPADAVCALRYEPDKIHYVLRTFAGETAAKDAGYVITHKGGCGTCSTLHDLAAYMARADLTAPVRSCAMRGITQGRTIRCLEALGLTRVCAETWYYNSRNTRRHCLGVCLASFLKGEPSNKPDGTLNDCIQCDEENSGPTFKRVAGRTRRNSGLHSSIDRAETEIYPVTHDYY